MLNSDKFEVGLRLVLKELTFLLFARLLPCPFPFNNVQEYPFQMKIGSGSSEDNFQDIHTTMSGKSKHNSVTFVNSLMENILRGKENSCIKGRVILYI